MVASLAFVAFQTRQLTRQTQTSNGIAALGAMYNGLERLHQIQAILIERPNLRPYFYSNKVPLDLDPEEGTRLLLLAELLGDVLDYGLMVVDLMPPVKEYEGWHDFATFLHEHSPVLRQIAYEHPEWWVRLIRHWQEAGLRPPAAEQSDLAGKPRLSPSSG
ncbi:hypothetical protein ACFOW4_00520 [Micromonospora sp. GCM10011542]|uniref:hypothetical protein n=1 Tax=Micromonospora sp. GCM10011542 TaxID=3317337 RepID=UPI00361BE6B6